MTPKQKTCSSKSAMHTKCCQILRHVVGTTDSATPEVLAPVQAEGQTHSVGAAVSATSLKRSSVVAVVVSKQGLRADKTLRSLHALISWQ
jgi:hypothetical protein